MALSSLFMALDIDATDPSKLQDLTENLYGKCPFCLKKALSIGQLIFDNKIKAIIQWFERQRAYRADIDN